MNTDITWCHGLNCDKSRTCRRWIARLMEHADKHGLRLPPVSMSAFEELLPECWAYWPEEKENGK